MENSKKIINLAKLNLIMKVSTILKSTFLTSLFVVSSCATTKYSEDVNRNRYGNDVNTVFSKTFAPRGFAAQEDELTAMKSQVKSIKKGNKIQITNDFHAY